MRAMGVDLGSRRIGLAVSDSDGSMAVPLETLARSGSWVTDHRAMADLAEELSVEVLVVGMPLSMDGGLGPAARRTMKELKVLRRTVGLPVETYDERLSTVEAHGSLRAAEVSPARRREVVDAAAASVILQGWLDARRGGTTRETRPEDPT